MSGGRVSIDRIKAAVAHEYKVPLREMTSARRDTDVVRPRQVAMALASKLTPHSSSNIGRLFGGRDHTTVLHAKRRIADLRAQDLEFDRRVGRLEADLDPPAETAPLRPEVQLSFLSGPLFDRGFDHWLAA